MKIKELINELKEYNPEADITLECSEDIIISYIDTDLKGRPCSKKNTPQCFIEPIDKYLELEEE